MTNLSKNDFITYWTGAVAAEFGLDQATLESVYTSSTYSVDSMSRDFFKYASSNGVSGTPTAFINGVMLDSVPRTVNAWLIQLEQVYTSQFQ
jgi:protein-disulfide isomerase